MTRIIHAHSRNIGLHGECVNEQITGYIDDKLVTNYSRITGNSWQFEKFSSRTEHFHYNVNAAGLVATKCYVNGTYNVTRYRKARLL